MFNPTAVITGTSSGIGRAIAEALVARKWSVIGISRQPVQFDSERYTHYPVDVSDSGVLTETTRQIMQQHGRVDALINNAGVGHFGPHEELSVEQITELVSVNLLAPLLLTKLLLRPLKEARGAVVNIASFSAWESSSHGAAYAATKAGLKHFGDSLFEETRRSGLRVVTISPDITRTPFYEDLSFAPEDDPEAAITPGCVARAVVEALQQRQGTAITHVVMRPQRVLLKKRPRP